MREDLVGHVAGTPPEPLLMSSGGDGRNNEVMSRSCRAGYSAPVRNPIQPLKVHNVFPQLPTRINP